MEFLIIVFVIISLFSSLSKQAKKGRRIEKRRKREIIFDPWSFEEELPEGRLKKKYEEAISIPMEEKSDSVHQIESESGVKESFGGDIDPLEVDREFSVSSYKEAKLLIESSYFTNEVKEKKTITKKIPPLYPKKRFLQLLRGGQLHLAIVFSEILGPPRALKPVRERFSEHIKKPSKYNS